MTHVQDATLLATVLLQTSSAIHQANASAVPFHGLVMRIDKLWTALC